MSTQHKMRGSKKNDTSNKKKEVDELWWYMA